MRWAFRKVIKKVIGIPNSLFVVWLQAWQIVIFFNSGAQSHHTTTRMVRQIHKTIAEYQPWLPKTAGCPQVRSCVESAQNQQLEGTVLLSRSLSAWYRANPAHWLWHPYPRSTMFHAGKIRFKTRQLLRFQSRERLKIMPQDGTVKDRAARFWHATHYLVEYHHHSWKIKLSNFLVFFSHTVLIFCGWY